MASHVAPVCSGKVAPNADVQAGQVLVADDLAGRVAHADVRPEDDHADPVGVALGAQRVSTAVREARSAHCTERQMPPLISTRTGVRASTPAAAPTGPPMLASATNTPLTSAGHVKSSPLGRFSQRPGA